MRTRLFFAAAFFLFLLAPASVCLAQGRERIVLEILPAGGGESAAAVKVEAEIAADAASREEGLMWRKSVPAGSGMIFIYPRDERMRFWMKNTLVPLSIAFIDSRGVLREILDMEPLDLTGVQSGGFRRFALEVPQGWFAENGIAAGSALSQETLDALKAIPARE